MGANFNNLPIVHHDNTIGFLNSRQTVCDYDRCFSGKTAIIIAHRLATVQKADRIIVMDNGQIVEIGSHEKLLQIEGGFYQNLHNVQLLQKQETI